LKRNYWQGLANFTEDLVLNISPAEEHQAMYYSIATCCRWMQK